MRPSGATCLPVEWVLFQASKRYENLKSVLVSYKADIFIIWSNTTCSWYDSRKTRRVSIAEQEPLIPVFVGFMLHNLNYLCKVSYSFCSTLCCLSCFEWWLLITPLVSSNISAVTVGMGNIFEDTKGVIIIRKSQVNRQHNGKKKKDKRTNNDLQNIHVKRTTYEEFEDTKGR